MKRAISLLLSFAMFVSMLSSMGAVFATNTDFTPTTAIEYSKLGTYMFQEKQLSTGSVDYDNLEEYFEDGAWKYYYWCDFTPEYSATYTIAIRSSKLMTAELYDADGNLLASESSPEEKDYTVGSTSYYYFELGYDLEDGETYYYKLYFSGGCYDSCGSFYYTFSSDAYAVYDENDNQTEGVTDGVLYVNDSTGYVYELEDYSVSQLIEDLSLLVKFANGSYATWDSDEAAAKILNGVKIYINTSDCTATVGEHTVVAYYMGVKFEATFYICEGHEYTYYSTADPTCEDDGYDLYICTKCQEAGYVNSQTSMKTNYVDAYGHTVESYTYNDDATCEEDGTQSGVCTVCGETVTVTAEGTATGHSWDDGTVTTEPTCTDEGVLTYTCQNDSSHTYTEAIEATGHTEGDVQIENEVDPTCEEAGSYDEVVYCTVCGAELSRETITVEATGHTAGEAVVENEVDPTCTEAGSYDEVVYCTVCGAELSRETITVEATGHSFTNYISNDDATCTEDGTKTAECDNGCGTTDTVTDEGTALGHDYVTDVTDPECELIGFTIHECSRCGDYYLTDIVEATGHTYVAEVTEPSCLSAGYTTYTCSVCGDTYTSDYVDATGHNYTADVTDPTCTDYGYTTYTCTACGDSYVSDFVEPTGHTYDDGTVTTEATCTDEGVMTYTCTVCGDTYTEAIAVIDHIYTAETTDPTCTEYGYTTYTCSVCGDSYTADYTQATGHNYTTEVTDPTCTDYGYATYTCTECDSSYISDYVEATGHTYDDGTVTTEATCTVEGVMTYTCTVCGDTYTEAIAVIDHSYTADVTDPTCTEYGYTTYTCSVCGDSYTADYTQATGHTAVIIEATDPTCEETGLTAGAYCSVCGAIIVEQEEVEATGHTAGEAVVENEVDPTCEETGSYDTVVYCTVCGAELSRETVTVEATGHTAGEAVVENEVDPTCEETGSYDEVVYCTVCGAELSRETIEVEATGHTAGEAVIENNVDPTCEETGSYDEVVYCTVCGAELSRETIEVEATGHTAGEAVVENEVDPTCEETGSYDTVVYCTVCGAELSRETIEVEATGHSFTNYISNDDATCTEDGTKTAECDNGCGTTDTVTDEGSATGHSYEITCTAATCTEDAYKTYVCSVCGDTYVETLEDTATGHTMQWVIVGENPVKSCSVCGYEKIVLKFTDIDDYDTYVGYYNYIAYTSYYNNFIRGTSSTTYAPMKTLTRAAAIAILYRMAGSPYDDGANPYTDETNPFSDVKTTAYYFNAACWALDNNITTETKFKGTNEVSRQETATFLYRYVCYCTDLEVTTESIESFPDADDVSSWALSAMQWAYANGLITGNSNGELNPQGVTYRIYASKIFYKFGVACNLGTFEPED